MKRLLKKLSSLCLAFVLGTSSFFGLSTNAAWERSTPESIEASEIVKVVKLYNKEDRDIVVFNSLLGRPKLRIYFHNGDEQKIRDVVEYCQTHFGFTSIETALVDLLRENGEEELAEMYKDYRRREIESIPVNKYLAPEMVYPMRDFEVLTRVERFFSRHMFEVSPDKPAKVGLYALIHSITFDKASERIAARLQTRRQYGF